MRYKRLADRRFCALKYNIVLQGSIFSSNGFLVCCGITILFIYKVLLYVMFKGFKAVVSCRVVLWENSKAGRVALVCWAVGCCAGLVDGLKGWLVGLWIECG